MANFFHGAFLLLSLALIPGFLQKIPLAALAAMLIYIGFRLASPKEFLHVYKIGAEQLFLFVATMLVTLVTDLLVGVAVGLVLKVLLHLKNGAPTRSLFRAVLHEDLHGDTLTLQVHEAAIFTNYMGLKKRLLNVDPKFNRVIIDLSNAWVVDHTVLANLTQMSKEWTDRKLIVTGLDWHAPMSLHGLAARRKQRPATA
ncbi:MAG: SulP family inorganic anion transporter [Bryobacterales bacterium]